MRIQSVPVSPRSWILPVALLAVLCGPASGETQLDQLRGELDALKVTINDMATRLAALEQQLKRPDDAVAGAPSTPTLRAEEPSLIQRLAERTRYPHGATAQPWYAPEPWTQIKMEMSAERVMEILGTPTFDEPSLNRRIDRVLTFQARDKDTNVKVKGKVKFKNDKVVLVEPPEFP